MQMDTRPEVVQPHNRSKWGKVVPAVAAVVVVLLGSVLFFRGTAEPVATTDEVAVAYAQARAAFDADAVVALMSDEVVVLDNWPGKNASELRAEMAWQEASGLAFTFQRCDTTGDAASCFLAFDSEVAAVHGYATDVYVYDLVVEDGEIVSANLADFGNYKETTWEPFRSWSISSIDRYAQLFDGKHPILTDESIGLWRSEIASYVAEQS